LNPDFHAIFQRKIPTKDSVRWGERKKPTIFSAFDIHKKIMHTYQTSSSGGTGGDVKYTELDSSFDKYENGKSSGVFRCFS
jgi:hypothetical protein